MWVLHLEIIVVTSSDDDIVHLQYHAAKLGREEQLLSLANKRIDHEVLPHIYLESISSTVY